MPSFVSRLSALLVVVVFVGSCGDDGRFPVEPRLWWGGDGPCDPNQSEICVCDEFHPDYPDCLPPPCDPEQNPGCQYRTQYTANPQRMDSLYSEVSIVWRIGRKAKASV